jgi:hypothetical protein
MVNEAVTLAMRETGLEIPKGNRGRLFYFTGIEIMNNIADSKGEENENQKRILGDGHGIGNRVCPIR